MALQFTTVEEPSFDRGIDARSAENQIKAGFARDLVNVDIVESRVRKRRGFVSHAGNIPVRVVEIEQDDASNKLSFILDSSIDLTRLSSCPLLAYGKSSNIGTITSANTSIISTTITVSGNPFTIGTLVPVISSTVSNIPAGLYYVKTSAGTDITIATSATASVIQPAQIGTITFGLGPFTTAGNSYRYYPAWESNLRKVLAANTTDTITASYTEHNIDTSEIFVGLAESTGTGSVLSGSTIFTDNVAVDDISYDISADYTNGSTTPVSAFLYYRDQSPVSGKEYTHLFSVPVSPTPNAVVSVPIDAFTHQLDSYNIIYQLQRKVGNEWVDLRPYSCTITPAGTITFGFINETESVLTDCRALLSSVVAAQTKSFGIASQQTTILNVDSPFVFYNLYLLDPVSNDKHEIKVDQVSYDDEDKSLTITWETPETSGTIEFFYNYGFIRTNRITVDDATVSSNTSDTAPQLSVYGLDHATLYGEEKKERNRRGWVTHVDSYRSPNTAHVVAGLGGNFFAALSKEQAPEFPQLLPTWFPRLNERVSDTTQYIGPAFTDLEVGNINRSRGAYTFAGGTFGWATVTSVAFDSGTGNTTYVLSTPGRDKPTGTAPIVAGDFLTVEKMTYSRHTGTFEIISCTETDANTLTIVVKNPKLTTTDYDDNSTAGRAGVFTDRVTLADDSPFIADDQLLSSTWGEETIMKVYEITGISSNVVLLRECYNNFTLSAGLILTGKRKSAKLPLRTALNEVPPSLNVVAGDVLTVDGFEREITVVSVNGNTVTLDEELEWYDDFSLPPAVSVSRRWYPIESPTPTATDTLVPRTTIQYFNANSYDNQPFVRSAMVRNNMYLTNSADEVFKYDGAHLSRAGIIPWQPGLFASVENIGTGGIGLTPIQVEIADAEIAGQKILIAKDKGSVLNVGSVVRVVFGNPSSTADLTIAAITEVSPTHVYLSFVETLTGVTDDSTIESITGIYYASYFFRFNIKDRNGVTTASAVSGDTSFIVKIAPTTSAQVVLLRLVGLPVWDKYDYRDGNVELEIFRSAWTTVSVGEIPLPYRLATIPLTFATNSGYIDFRDTYANISLSEEDSDLVSRVLSPSEVPVTWDEPLRAKYTTTVGNRLVLGNITSWPTLTVEFLANKDTSAADFAGQKFTFRRDVTNAGTTTDMNNVAVYELRQKTGNINTIYPVIDALPNLGQFKFAATTALPTGLAKGNWVYLFHDVVSSGSSTVVNSVNTSNEKFGITGTIPNGTLVHFSCTGTYPTYVGGAITPGQGYFVINSSSNEFQIALTQTATVPLDITAANSPDSTLTVLWDGSELTYSGWWQISDVSGGIVTIKKSGTSFTTLPTQFPDRALFATNPANIPVLVGEDGNLGMANGNGPVPYLNVIRRLGMAINATMRLVDTTIPAYSNFVPWLMAQSEAWTGGQLIVRRPRADQETPTLQVTPPSPIPPSTVVQYSTYVNDEIAPATPVPAVTRRYPSRVLVSYDNYPEIFSNPLTDDLSTSVSAIDVNAADGQEITGVVPFFGSSAFDAAQQSGVLVVFKQNSIYIINVNTRQVQKLETQGLGCIAPYSIAPTKDGVAFANESGIYVLRRDYRIEYMGRFMERNWQQTIDLDALLLAQGHHYGIGQQYKLSLPLTESSTSSYAENEQVFVYNYTGEADGNLGGWTKYTNHYATGWCNLFQDAFFADVDGKVQRIRNVGNNSDYRDGATAITAIIETRPTAFENTAIRKAVSNIVVHYRSGADSDKTTLGMATDLATEYQASTAFRVMTSGLRTGLADTVGQDVVSIMHSFPKRKCLYAGVQIVNSGLDDNVEVAGMSYVVAGLSPAGVKQAAETGE